MSGQGKLWTPGYQEPQFTPPEIYTTGRPREERIWTPADDRKIVKHDLLIDHVKAEIEDKKKIFIGRIKVHHFLWPDTSYRTELERTFLDLPPNKGLMYALFEQIIHDTTLPPEKPQPEVMMKYIEAWSVTASLFTAARSVERTSRYGNNVLGYLFSRLDDRSIDEEIVEDMFNRHFKKIKGSEVHFGRMVERIVDIQPQFADLPPANELGQKVSSDVAKILGPLVAGGCINLKSSTASV